MAIFFIPAQRVQSIHFFNVSLPTGYFGNLRSFRTIFGTVPPLEPAHIVLGLNHCSCLYLQFLQWHLSFGSNVCIVMCNNMHVQWSNASAKAKLRSLYTLPVAKSSRRAARDDQRKAEGQNAENRMLRKTGSNRKREKAQGMQVTEGASREREGLIQAGIGARGEPATGGHKRATRRGQLATGEGQQSGPTWLPRTGPEN